MIRTIPLRTAALAGLLLLDPAPTTASAGGPKNANCAHAGMLHGGACGVGHEQCCGGPPGGLCPMRTFTKPAAVFHLGNARRGPYQDITRCHECAVFVSMLVSFIGVRGST